GRGGGPYVFTRIARHCPAMLDLPAWRFREGAPMSTERARQLRLNSSVAERRMWRILHVFRTGGYHFRKQAQIGPYYADIACHHAKLVVELDGDTHGTDAAARRDRRRDAFL